nr:hypothetical protein [Tanacetum cinerariifolium]
MVAFLSKFDASIGIDQIGDFLNAHAIQYALVVNPTIYVSCIKQFWATATIKKVNDAVQLCALINKKKVVVTKDVIRSDLHLHDVDGVECLPNEEIFVELARMGYEKTHPKLTFYKKVFANMRRVRKGFLGVETPLFASMLVQPQPQAAKKKKRNVDNPSKFLMYPCFLQVIMDNQVDDLTSHNTRYTSLALTQKVFANMRRVGKVPITPAPSPPPQDPTPKPHATPPQAQHSTPHASPPQEHPTTTSESSMSLLNTLQSMHPNRGELEAIDADEDITLVYLEKDKEDVSATEPAVFDDEEVRMTMAQTLIKLKAEIVKLLNEQISQKLHDEEVKKLQPGISKKRMI